MSVGAVASRVSGVKDKREGIKPSRTESFVMMIVTLIYLAFEVAFGARLLDVVSTTMDKDTLHQIENAGRIISGVALTLVVWSFLVLPFLRRRGFPFILSTLCLIASLAASCAMSYWIQEQILQAISTGSNADQRQAASTLTLLTASAQSDHLNLDGIDIDAIGRDRPEVKTFLALLPALALSTEDLQGKTGEEIERMLRYQAEDRIGGFQKFFEEVYEPAREKMEQAFNDYVGVADTHREARSRVADEQARAWKNYRNSLGEYSPWDVPKRMHDRIRQRVAGDIPIPWDWNVGDRDAFNEAVRKKMMFEVGPAYERAMRGAFGFVPPDNLEYGEFFRNPDIQEFWRDKMGMEPDVLLDNTFSEAKVREKVYEEWIDRMVADGLQLYVAPVDEFHDGAGRAVEGIEAVRIAWIPLIAFFFSLIGAFVHLFKTAVFGAKAICGVSTPSGSRRVMISKCVLAAVVVGAGIVISGVENGVSRSELFFRLEEQTGSRSSPIVAGAIRIVIQMQPYVYPVADATRLILGGITFDFDPETATPPFSKNL